jgi:hypothetical protein
LLSHPAAHKLVPTPPERRAARTHPSAPRVALISARRKKLASATPRSKNAPHSLSAERATAAHAAIAAADHRYLRSRPYPVNRARFERTSLVLTRRSRRYIPRFIPQATGRSTRLTNIGGVLQTSPDSLPLDPLPAVIATPMLRQPLRLSSLYDSGGRLILPRPLYGSHDILLHQNEMADHDGVDRIQDDADLIELRKEKKLVALPESEALRIDYRLPEDRRYSRPWTAAFLSLLAADFYATFHTSIQVDSAVRTVAVQQRLLRTNGNAAPSTGEAASPHLTGQAVDIAKGGLNLAEIAWMRTYLQPFIDLGKIDVEEEFQQSCFHISVYKSFLPSTSNHLSVASARPAASGDSIERPPE